jgi:MazG family protein
LREVVERLRRECPWDAAQDLRSMRPYLLEESYEVLDAIDRGHAEDLEEELGDLLFQVLFLSTLAAEAGGGGIDAVARRIEAKMIARHPHVFGGGGDASIAGWERRKAVERRRSRIDGVPASLPALVRAHRVGEKAGAAGLDWPSLDGVLDKVREELDELAEARARSDLEHAAREYGDLLLALSSVGRHLGVAGEDALREASLRFEARFRAVEAAAQAAGVDMADAGPDRLDAWWQDAKR